MLLSQHISIDCCCYFSSNHSNSSFLNENCDQTIENDPTSSIHAPDADILKKINSGHCGNNNNNFLNNNNNNNNNIIIHKSHKNDNIEHKSGQQCSELKATNMCSVQNRCDEMAVIVRPDIDVEGDDLNENDTHSTKSNFSNIDVEIEKDERKPNLKKFTGAIMSINDSNSWISSGTTDKLTTESNLIYTNCDGDTTVTHPTNMATNLKKEVSLKKKHFSRNNFLSFHFDDC